MSGAHHSRTVAGEEGPCPSPGARHCFGDSALVGASPCRSHRRQPGRPLETMVHARLADPVAAARSCSAKLISLKPEFCAAAEVAAPHEAGIAVLTTVLSEA